MPSPGKHSCTYRRGPAGRGRVLRRDRGEAGRPAEGGVAVCDRRLTLRACVVAVAYRLIAFEGGAIALAHRGVAPAERLVALGEHGGPPRKPPLPPLDGLAPLAQRVVALDRGCLRFEQRHVTLSNQPVALLRGSVALAPGVGEIPGDALALCRRLLGSRPERFPLLAQPCHLSLEPSRARLLGFQPLVQRLLADGPTALSLRLAGHRGQGDDDAWRHRQLDLPRIGRIALPGEGGDPGAPLLGGPGLVLQQRQQVARPILRLDGQRRPDEAQAAHAEPTARNLQPIITRELEALQLEGDPPPISTHGHTAYGDIDRPGQPSAGFRPQPARRSRRGARLDRRPGTLPQRLRGAVSTLRGGGPDRGRRAGGGQSRRAPPEHGRRSGAVLHSRSPASAGRCRAGPRTVAARSSVCRSGAP